MKEAEKCRKDLNQRKKRQTEFPSKRPNKQKLKKEKAKRKEGKRKD